MTKAARLGLYCKRLGWGQFISQYTLVYCDLGERDMGRAVLQYSHYTSDTARRPGARGAHARCAGHAGRRRALGARGARPGRAAGLWAVHLVHSACF